MITLPGIVVGSVLAPCFRQASSASLIGILVGGGSLWLIGEAYYRYAGQEGMGGGDVKMLAMIGAFLGWKLVLVTLVFSSVAGAVIGLLVIRLEARVTCATRCRTGRFSRSPASSRRFTAIASSPGTSGSMWCRIRCSTP